MPMTQSSTQKQDFLESRTRKRMKLMIGTQITPRVEKKAVRAAVVYLMPSVAQT